MKRRFEYRKGKSNKFWEIEVRGGPRTSQEIVRRWGRIGSQGQVKVEPVVTQRMALARAQALAQEKLDKGYVEVGLTGAELPEYNTVSTPKPKSKRRGEEAEWLERLQDKIRAKWGTDAG